MCADKRKNNPLSLRDMTKCHNLSNIFLIFLKFYSLFSIFDFILDDW